jgi:hypothetical protein
MPDMFPRNSRSAANKAAQAIKHEAREAEKAERAALKEARRQAAEAAREGAQARAQAATKVLLADIPRTQGEVRQIAKALTPRMLELLVEIAEDPTQQASGRVAAINAIIDRAHGKPVQPVTEVPGAVLHDMDDAALDVYIVERARKFIDGKVIEHVQHQQRTTEANIEPRAIEPPAREDRQLQDRPCRPKGRGKGA